MRADTPPTSPEAVIRVRDLHVAFGNNRCCRASTWTCSVART
jgi:hypothetical protein